jgi:hypothetical protein
MSQKQSILSRVVGRMASMLHCQAVSEERLAAIEERLQRLDGGDCARNAKNRAESRVVSRIGKAKAAQ